MDKKKFINLDDSSRLRQLLLDASDFDSSAQNVSNLLDKSTAVGDVNIQNQNTDSMPRPSCVFGNEVSNTQTSNPIEARPKSVPIASGPSIPRPTNLSDKDVSNPGPSNVTALSPIPNLVPAVVGLNKTNALSPSPSLALAVAGPSKVTSLSPSPNLVLASAGQSRPKSNTPSPHDNFTLHKTRPTGKTPLYKKRSRPVDYDDLSTSPVDDTDEDADYIC